MATLGVTTPPGSKAIRVVQWGTGNTGTIALQAMAAPSLELVGVWAHNPDAAANDAIGVAITDSKESVLATAPDCVSYMATDRGRHDDVIDDFCMILVAGSHLVTTTNPLLVHPAGDGLDIQDRIEVACLPGRSSFFLTGSNPVSWPTPWCCT